MCVSRCMSKCVAKLNSITELSGQVLGGGDPNISGKQSVGPDIFWVFTNIFPVLLGTRDLQLQPALSPVTALDRDLAPLSCEEKLVVVREQLAEVGGYFISANSQIY